MKRRRMVFAGLVCAWPLAAMAAATKGPTGAAGDPAEGRAFREVIQAQLKAFAADQPEQAYAHAAPAIRRLFPSAAEFMRMVKGAYPVLLAPASVVFLKPAMVDGAWTQAVQLTDTGGRPWLATYVMEQQADKTWRIAGCALSLNQGQAT